jgi:PTH1 family peptidyl-tRNA hydrolase
MKLIVGLGNHGERYRRNRHNVGFLVVDRMRSELGEEDWKESKKGKLLNTWIHLGNEKIQLLKPQTMVNGSGLAVAYARRKHSDLSPDDIFVVHDDLDMALGTFKIQKGKGPKIHKGLSSIYDKLGKSDFWHVRVGIESRKKPIKIFKFKLKGKMPGERFVLQNFTENEVEILDSVIDNVIKDLRKKLK